MPDNLRISLLIIFCGVAFSPAMAQTQACPVNSNFSSGDLTHWYAYTGNNKNGNGINARIVTYDSTSPPPTGTIGATQVQEYNLPSVTGIQILTQAGVDPFGGFSTVPTINGYKYNYSMLLGSTAVSRGGGGGGGNQGGYVRGVSYEIDVPLSATVQPYTMTYAYAMVLENGAHNSNQQPLASATLSTHDSVITCASPSYYLPTLNNADGGGRGATLDVAAAQAQGFSLSSQVSPNSNPGNPAGGNLQDVWTKGWTEVTFDLSPYRGQKVTLTFEADNCMPGGHFSYIYIAVRNTCAGLDISGDLIACTNSNMIYSIPALAGATYEWTVPSDWTVVSGAQSSILTVTPGVNAGKITAHEINGCADLRDTIDVTTRLPTIAGAVSSDHIVCAGTNSTPLTLGGYRGDILGWVASGDGSNWRPVPNGTPLYTATDLNTTTIYRAVLQNGPTCRIDTSTAATVVVDPKSVGGDISPANRDICEGQNQGAPLTLNNSVGAVQSWQSTQDGVNWTDINPLVTGPVYSISGVSDPTKFRAIVKSGVCPADISATAVVNIIHVPFPQAVIHPSDTTICYNTPAQLFARIDIGTRYNWATPGALTALGNGPVPSTPYSISAEVTLKRTLDYLLTVENAGCPNLLTDTFHVAVLPEVVVDAGRDTMVVINQPLQLHSSASDTAVDDRYEWTPVIGLNNAFIPDPVAVLGADTDSIRYTLKVTTAASCYGTAAILVRVFKTGPSIFVPNAFTPGKGINGIFRPIAPGVASLSFFKVFNRWGQLVYSTNRLGQGWDGITNGKAQPNGSFVWTVQGKDYNGKIIAKQGTMILIR